ncbi:hypothetical protein BaRGS_00039263 [Batillaria attramentaria]|uniref:Hexosyltransferase n=1 Tax=Batillaria attramentaria TaxID=370345 RepID=A0ABD0J3K0_9CAEN
MYVIYSTILSFTRRGKTLSYTQVADDFWLDSVASDFFKPRSSVISTLHDRLLIHPVQPCNSATYMIILVFSLPEDFLWRKTIRNTWSGAAKKNRWPRMHLRVHVEVFFIVGQRESSLIFETVKEEASRHHDIIMGDFTDSYRNLTYKTLAGLSWVSQHCSHTKFVMKLDQDTFVDLPRLLSFLSSHDKELHNSVIGKFYSSPLVKSEGKWKVTRSEYPFSMYPAFAGGPCYIISTDVVHQILQTSQHMPFFHLEDVLVTGIIAKTLGLYRYSVEQLQNFYKNESLCAFIERPKTQLSMTELSREKIRHVWKTIVTDICIPFKKQSV